LEDFSGFATQLELAKIFREKLKIFSCAPELIIVYSKKALCISLTNNYKRGNIPPPKADVEAIRNFLGMEESAAWFLEAQSCRQWDVRKF
jgi:hypothetical protein